MNRHSLPVSFRRSAMAAAVSSLCLLPTLNSQAAEPVSIGAEFAVNTLTAGNQITPAVAIDADGDFVVAWTSNIAGSDEIRARRYNTAGQAQGAEFKINTVTTGTQSAPAVALDAVGNFVVAWQSDAIGNQEIRARRYNAAGVAQGGEFKVNNGSAGNQSAPALSLDADGDFVIAWQSDATYSHEIRARRFDAAGVAQDVEFRVNSVTADEQTRPSLSLDADGDFVVAWQSGTPGIYDIRARRYNAAGLAQGAEFPVDTLLGSQFSPAVALDADGDFVVAWQSNYYGNEQIRAQRYNASGVVQGGEFEVTTIPPGFISAPAIALDADGDFVVAWHSHYYFGGGEIRAQRYDATGVAQGPQIAVNTVTTADQTMPAIALDADGDFVVAWQSDHAGNDDIRAQRHQGSDPVDVSLSQTDSADPSPVGSPITYTLDVSNLHPPLAPTGIAAIDSAIGLATGLRVVDKLPAGSTAVSASGLDWSCTFPSGRAICDYALPLSAGQPANALTVTLTPPNTPGVLLSNVGEASADQFDDDLPNNREVEKTQLICAESVIQFSAADYNISEQFGLVAIIATRSGGNCGVATVQYDTAGGTATQGSDFTDVTGTLTWPAGDLSNKGFNVPIAVDTLDEINEQLLLTLSNVSGASLGARNTANLTILDNDDPPTVSFNRPSGSADEATATTVRVQLSAASGKTVTVPYARNTRGFGNASFPADYSLSLASPIIFAPGEIEKLIVITPVDDAIDEANEVVGLILGTPTNATLGAITNHQRTIVDNDP